jgi:hypothetical protein
MSQEGVDIFRADHRTPRFAMGQALSWKFTLSNSCGPIPPEIAVQPRAAVAA